MAENKKSFKCPHCGLSIDHVDIGKEEKLELIQQKFYDSLTEYVSEFGAEMVRDFFDYWTEPNKSKTKIKWQLERTWDTKRRLQRWQRNKYNGQTKKNNNRGFESDSTNEAIRATINAIKGSSDS